MRTKLVLRVFCLLLVALSMNSCNGTFNRSDDNITDPKTLLEKYFSTKTWQDRLMYVEDSANVRPIMEEYYLNANLSDQPKIKEISQIANKNSTSKDSILIFNVTFSAKNPTGAAVSYDLLYYLKITKSGLKIDWPSSIGYNPIKLNVYKATKPNDVKIFRLTCKIDDYYNYGYRESSDDYYSIECSNLYNNDHEEYSSLHSYILKNSEDGIKLFNILKDGKPHRVTIALKYDYKSEGNSGITAMKQFISEGWCYSTNSLNLVQIEQQGMADINTVQTKEQPTESSGNEGFKGKSNTYDPIDPRSRPGRDSYYQYTSNEWLDMSKGFDYGSDHPINETTEIRETESRIIIDFSSGKSLIYAIVKVEPYEYGINYIVEIAGKRKTITKGPAVEGGIRFSLEKEWMFNKILEAIPAGID